MKILICISNVPDTTTHIRLNSNGMSADLSQVQWIINPWDELALTRAIDLREKHPELVESITVITVGLKEAEGTLRKALAVGADKAIRINATATDQWQVANELATAIKKENYDLVMAGIESSDYNGSAVGTMAGVLCDYPVASNVSSLDFTNGKFTVVQETDTGRETISITPPLLAVVQKGIAIEARIPAMRGIMLARQKPLEVVEAEQQEPLQEIAAMENPPPKAPCKVIDAGNLEQLVKALQNELNVI